MNTENRYQETDLGNVSPNPRGEYTPGTEYEYLDLVTFDGGSYICIAELGTTTSISPESGKNTDFWQCMTIPGDMTPEYVAMHDRVVNLSEQVEADAEEVRAAEQNVSGMKENVTQMQEQTRQSAESAERSKDSAAGYAASADASRQAAETSEQNINAQVTGFDAHVAEKTSESEQSIEAARIAANKAMLAQQEQSVGEVARVGGAAVSEAQTAARVATEKASAASESEKNAKASETAAKLSETNATKMAEQVAADKEQVAYDRTAVENAKQEMTGSVAQIEQNTQGITELKSDIDELSDEISFTEYINATYTENKYINENGAIANGNGMRIATLKNVKCNDVIVLTANTTNYWTCMFGYYADGTPHALDQGGYYSNTEIKITDENIVTVRAWSLGELRLKKYTLMHYINKNKESISESNENITEIKREVNGKPKYNFGYIDKDGYLHSEPSGVHKYAEYNDVKVNDEFIFSGGYQHWGVLWGYDKNGSPIQLLSAGTYYEEKVTITNNAIVKVIGWSDTRIKELSLLKIGALNVSNNIIVDVNGFGDFTDIQSAINYAHNNFDVDNHPVTIFIRNGVYNVSPTPTYPFYAINKGANKISLIGESRDGVIIRCICTSELQGIALNVGGECTISNMTVENLADVSYTVETKLEGSHRPYCIHNDEPPADISHHYYTTISNVKCYSECCCPIGAGLHHKQTQRYDRVECIFAENAVDYGQGALYLHAPYDASFVADGIELVDCVLLNYAKDSRAISIPDVTGSQPIADVKLTFIRNMTASATWHSVFVQSLKKNTIISNGNSDDVLNYHSS